MARETKLISTETDFSVVGTAIALRSFYKEDILPDTIQSSIPDSDGLQDGVNYIGGELLIKMKNSPENINYYVDNNGHLILIIGTGDADKYSINSDGHLIYTTEE